MEENSLSEQGMEIYKSKLNEQEKLLVACYFFDTIWEWTVSDDFESFRTLIYKFSGIDGAYDALVISHALDLSNLLTRLEELK